MQQKKAKEIKKMRFTKKKIQEENKMDFSDFSKKVSLSQDAQSAQDAP